MLASQLSDIFEREGSHLSVVLDPTDASCFATSRVVSASCSPASDLRAACRVSLVGETTAVLAGTIATETATPTVEASGRVATAVGTETPTPPVLAAAAGATGATEAATEAAALVTEVAASGTEAVASVTEVEDTATEAAVAAAVHMHAGMGMHECMRTCMHAFMHAADPFDELKNRPSLKLQPRSAESGGSGYLC